MLWGLTLICLHLLLRGQPIWPILITTPSVRSLKRLTYMFETTYHRWIEPTWRSLNTKILISHKPCTRKMTQSESIFFDQRYPQMIPTQCRGTSLNPQIRGSNKKLTNNHQLILINLTFILIKIRCTKRFRRIYGKPKMVLPSSKLMMENMFGNSWAWEMIPQKNHSMQVSNK